MQHAADGTVLDVGRRTRTIPPAIRRALTARDQRCRFPGCTARARHCEAHHIEHWADGGATRLENLLLTCRFHHRLVHEGGWTAVRRPHGEIAFVRPDGRVLPEAPHPPEWPMDTSPLAPTTTRLATAGMAIDSRTTMPDADGAPFDVGWALDVLRPLPPGALDVLKTGSPGM